MYKFPIFFLINLIISTYSFGQNTFEYIIGGYDNDQVSDMARSPDGGYYIVGGTGSFGEGGIDVLLVKVDKNGILAWSKSFGTSDIEIGRKIKLDHEGNIIILASFPYLNSECSALIKVNPLGNIIW